jgi:NNP family nitrate/nitrite transporter-like MFS transporter
VQFLVPWVVGFTLLGTAFLGHEEFVDPNKGVEKDIWLHNAGIVFIPWVLLGALLAWRYLKSVPVKANFRQQTDIFREKHTWLMTALYIMTFGAFSGFAAQFPLLIKNLYGTFENAPDPLRYAFLGPLVGSAARVAWGPLCDRFGGAVWTLVSGIGMTASTIFTVFWLSPESMGEFKWFVLGMLAIFLFAGIGNAATFKQMPMIFDRRQAGGVIGWTAAIAAYGPFVFGVALASIAAPAFFAGCAVFFAACIAITWYYYARPGAERPS